MPGISYSGWKNRADGLNIVDPNLSRILREAVQKRTVFAQFAVEKINIGTGKGNEEEIVMADDDPVVCMVNRHPQNEMAVLLETELNFAAHSYKSMEFGISIKYNVGDVSLSEFNLEAYVRDFLSRDVARVRDLLTQQEMDLSPYKYIPYNEREGAFVESNAYYKWDTQRWNGPALAVIAAAVGKVIPVQYAFYNGNFQNLPLGAMAQGTRRKFVANPLFIGYQGAAGTMQVGPVWDPALQGKSPVDLRTLDASSGILNPAGYPLPRLNLIHVRNMVAHANRLGLLPYEKLRYGDSLREGYVLIAPSIQINNLIDSINWLGQNGNLGGYEPATMEALNAIPKIAGASFMVPGLSTPVLAVVDDYSTQNSFNIYNIGNVGGARQEWSTQRRSLWGATLDARNAGGGVVNTASLAAVELEKREGAGAAGIAFAAQDYLPLGYGPAYLFGRDCVQELVNIPWQIRKMESVDFKRIEGYAWVMRTGYKNYWVPNTPQTTEGMPFAANGNLISDTVANYYNRNRIIKFDWPTWVRVA